MPMEYPMPITVMCFTFIMGYYAGIFILEMKLDSQQSHQLEGNAGSKKYTSSQWV